MELVYSTAGDFPIRQMMPPSAATQRATLRAEAVDGASGDRGPGPKRCLGARSRGRKRSEASWSDEG